MTAESVAFKDWLKSENLVQFTKVTDFKDTLIALDAEEYLASLLSNPTTREPLLPALGGLPFALHHYVDNDLSHLRNASITPVFIFNGLDLQCRDRKGVIREVQKANAILSESWKLYDEGKGNEAVQSFGKACNYRTAHIKQHLLYYLHKKGVRIMTAPYSAAAQAVHLEKNGSVHCVSGSASILVFGAEKVILEFNWTTQNVAWASSKQILQKLMLSPEQFEDLCLLSGSSILPTMPEIDNDTMGSKIPATRAVMSRAGQDGHTACLQSKDEAYLTLFQKAKMCARHMVVLWKNGDVKQTNFETSPSDLHDSIGQRLPEELIAYFSRGMIGSRVLNWRTRQEVFETPPLDGGSSQVYRTLVQEKLRSLRARSLAILTHSLNRYYQNQDVDLVCWFSENDRRPLGITDMPLQDITRDAETWHVLDAFMEKSTLGRDLDVTISPICFAIAVLADDTQAKKTDTPRKSGEHSVLESGNELLANSVWRFLQDRGYINTDHTLSAWGKALRAAFQHAANATHLSSTHAPEEVWEAIFLAFELYRLDLLNNKQMFNPPLSGGAVRGTETDKGNTLLLSRIACLGSSSHKEIGYTGPLSRHLLAYQQTVAAVRNSLRDLVEMHAANMMLSASAKRDRDLSEYTDLGARLPFAKEIDCGLALVVKSYLDELSAEKKPNVKAWFGHLENIDEDLLKAWDMWGAVSAGIQAADSAIVSSDTKDSWRSIDAWLKKKLESAKVSKES